MIKIDSLDRQIVESLGQNALQSKEVLAKKLNTSPATIRRRLKKLISRDVLRIIGVVDSKAFGIPIAAWISLDVEHDKLDSAAKILSQQPEIRVVSTTSGRFDLVALGRFSTNEHLSEFMAKVMPLIYGLIDREVIICLSFVKDPFIPFP